MFKNFILSLKNSLVLRVIANKNIVVHERPFRHIVVDNFFEKSFYNQLCDEFNAYLKMGLSDEAEKSKFRSLGDYYDAYSFVPDPKIMSAFSFFYTPAWDKFITGVFNTESSKDVSVAFHHHKVGSKSGFAHADFNYAGFSEDRLSNGMNPWYYQRKYEIHTSSSDDESSLLRRVRHVTVLYYLSNEPWHEGDGGETGLYAADGKTLVKKVAPVNNRLLAFEVSPRSFHNFLSNEKATRNSVIQWFHSTPEMIRAKYPNATPVGWENKDKWAKEK